MKKIIVPLLLLMVFGASNVNGQQKKIDSLRAIINALPPDTVKAANMAKLANVYYTFKPDSTIKIANAAYILAVNCKNQHQQALSLTTIANAYSQTGDFGKAMLFYFKAIKVYEAVGNQYGLIQTENNIGSVYGGRNEYKKALQHLYIGKKAHDDYVAKNKNPNRDIKVINLYLLVNMGGDYVFLKQADSAEYFLNLGVAAAKRLKFHDLDGLFDNSFGDLETLKDDRNAAIRYYRKALADFTKLDDAEGVGANYLSMARMFQKYYQPDSALYYAQLSLTAARKGGFLQDALDAGKFLSKLYDDQRDIPNAYKYYKEATMLNDSLYNQDKVRELLSIDFDEKQRQQELAQAREAYANTVRIYILAGSLAVLLLLVVFFWRNSQQRKKANLLLHQQKEEVQSALSQLQLTQRQLVQAEKMASLGELTAGIAHEIQNPLNFVNNFSEVNAELIGEMKQEIDKGDLEEIRVIATDIEENSKKISQHGKRADAIVKGMLQHSKASTGVKEPTDLNALTDEYLRLAYHGLRSKDKSFNVEIKTNFDETLPFTNVIPQDIGRILLNLFNNAFYAVHQKAKTAGEDYKPGLEIRTFAPPSGGWGATVQDNGTGIPDAIKDKIMQPFFTTKPTGEGTGLGLSLSYDIIVKGHGGTITVESTEGEGTVFAIILPA